MSDELSSANAEILRLNGTIRQLKEEIEVGTVAQRNLVAQANRLSTARDIIAACAEQFRDYSEVHAAKSTPEGDIKSRSNRAFAELCESWLG